MRSCSPSIAIQFSTRTAYKNAIQFGSTSDEEEFLIDKVEVWSYWRLDCVILPAPPLFLLTFLQFSDPLCPSTRSFKQGLVRYQEEAPSRMKQVVHDGGLTQFLIPVFHSPFFLKQLIPRSPFMAARKLTTQTLVL